MDSTAGERYPQWWYDRAAARKLVLDQAVEQLRERAPSIPHLVGFLVFGSYAAGRVGPESDLDVIAVTNDPEPLLGNRYYGIVRHLERSLPLDLVVYRREEYERLAQTWPFVVEARRAGIWIDAAAAA